LISGKIWINGQYERRSGGQYERRVALIHRGDLENMSDDKPTCRSFQLQPIEIPEACAEVVALIQKTFTKPRQWDYLRIFIELYAPQFHPRRDCGGDRTPKGDSNNMIGLQFKTPYVHEGFYGDEADNPDGDDTAYQWFAFDTPEQFLPYSPSQKTTIESGAIRWILAYELETFLRNLALAALNLTLTAKGNLKKPDQEHFDRLIRRLREKIETDLQMWLENDSRYQELIRDRVNEAIHDLLERRNVKTAA
jgi:hypothetical protein